MEYKMKAIQRKQGMSAKLAYRVFCNEYAHWICDPKWIVMLALVVLMREVVICPMMNAAEEMGQIVNLLEPAIAIGNSGLILLLLPLFYIILISDCPFISSNLYYLLPRTGRLNWGIGELLFQFVSVLTYLGVVVMCSILQVFEQAYFINGWSLVVTRYDYLHEGQDALVCMKDLIPGQLYNQMSPFQAFFLTYGLLMLYLLLWNAVALLATLYARKKIIFWAEIAVMAVGMSFAALKNKFMWLFPSGHAIAWLHYQTYYRKYVFPVWASLLLFAVCLCVVYGCIYRRVEIVSMDILWEEKTG